MRFTLVLGLLLLVGCDEEAGLKTYRCKQVGYLSGLGTSPQPKLYVTVIEGHRYYVVIREGKPSLGPEVPDDSWKAIQRRQAEYNEEFIQLPEKD